MKKQLFILALTLVCSTASFAQSTFTEQVLRNQMKDYFDNTTNYLKGCPSEFVLISDKGTITSRDQWISFTTGTKSWLDELTNVSIKQVGGSAIATGQWKHHHEFANGSKENYRGMFVLSFANKDGKWLLTSQQEYPIQPASKPVKSVVYHKVESYAKWKAVFDSAEGFRKEFGEISAESGTLQDDPKTVYVIQEWETLDNMQKLFASPKLREEMGKGGVVSAPTILVLNKN